MSRKLIALALASDLLTIPLWTSWYGGEPYACARGQCGSHAETIRLALPMQVSEKPPLNALNEPRIDQLHRLTAV
jgi:hypothetical protein